jgi:hypothetical protein
MLLTKIKKLEYLLKELEKPGISYKRTLFILENFEKEIHKKKIMTMEDYEKQISYNVSKEYELESKHLDDIIIDVQENTSLWMEYESELERAKPYDCFKKFIGVKDIKNLNWNPEKVRQQIFRYFEIGNPKTPRTMVKYYTVYKAFEELKWI